LQSEKENLLKKELTFKPLICNKSNLIIKNSEKREYIQNGGSKDPNSNSMRNRINNKLNNSASTPIITSNLIR